MSISTVNVYTVAQPDGRVRWGIRVDGADHGGGEVISHSAALHAAAGYLRGIESRAPTSTNQTTNE